VPRAMESGWPCPRDGEGEDEREEEEKDSCDLKPKDAADTAEGAKKAANATGNAAGGPACHLAGGAGLRRARLPGVNWAGGWRAGLACGSTAGGGTLAGDAAGDAQAHAECPSDGFRLHFDSMVTVCRWRLQGAPSVQRRFAQTRRWK
jgi:hypothetical protein